MNKKRDRDCAPEFTNWQGLASPSPETALSVRRDEPFYHNHQNDGQHYRVLGDILALVAPAQLVKITRVRTDSRDNVIQ
jgi:hypothetical protein